MNPEAGLPQLYYPQDPLRAGLTHLKDAATPKHPLETGLKQQAAAQTEAKKNLLRNTQGVHAAMRLNMEQTILSQYRRLPGFHSEFVGLETMNESMTQIGVEDFLNDPRESMQAPIAMHEGMERLLGVAPVEPFHHKISTPTLAMRSL